MEKISLRVSEVRDLYKVFVAYLATMLIFDFEPAYPCHHALRVFITRVLLTTTLLIAIPSDPYAVILTQEYSGTTPCILSELVLDQRRPKIRSYVRREFWYLSRGM
jgi:hypothetical protein